MVRPEYDRRLNRGVRNAYSSRFKLTNAVERASTYKRLFQLAKRWNVVRFLFCGGTMLVILGLAGGLGLLGSLSGASLFNQPYWIELGSSLVRCVCIGGRNHWQQEAPVKHCTPCSTGRNDAGLCGSDVRPVCCLPQCHAAIDRFLGSSCASRRRDVGDLGIAQQ